MKPLDRIQVIRQSLVVFICGVCGLLPVIGLFPATYALVSGYRIRGAYSEFNPAANYLKWGRFLGLLGVLISLLAALAFGISIVSQDGRNWNG